MINKLQETYRGKKVFLTGHTGFKGSWMLMTLDHFGAAITGYALAPESTPNLYDLLDGDSLCNSVIADIRDLETLKKSIADAQPDFIIHMAAQALVRRSYDEPVDTFDVNLMGTVNLLEAARHLTKPCQIIIITTDKVYENAEEWHPYAEDEKLGGYDPYSASKACAEIATSSYRRSFFHPINYAKHNKSLSSVRAGNVIGGGDWAMDRIIPDLVRAMEKGEELVVRNPDSFRPWQHVLEPVCGYLFLGAKMLENPTQFASAYNFGPQTDDTLSVKDLVEEALKVWGEGTYRIERNPDAPHEANLLQLDISKAGNEIGWQPKMNSRQAIDATISWYKNYEENPAEYTIMQIENYLNS
ncbi:MAG: CDP-glucose 4,6-dehydratase [Bacteroidetes bacterium]|nr:CDP-glucose 4,6-dehydratase [Bacteroidota bacterium]